MNVIDYAMELLKELLLFLFDVMVLLVKYLILPLFICILFLCPHYSLLHLREVLSYFLIFSVTLL